MKIVIKTKNLKLDRTFKDFINEKINSLEGFLKILQDKKKYFNHFFGKGKPRVEVWVEIEKTTHHHKKGPFFRAEAQMRLPGKSLRAEAEREDLKMAVVEVKDELQRQLKEYKEKAEAISKRKMRSVKKMFHLSLY